MALRPNMCPSSFEEFRIQRRQDTSTGGATGGGSATAGSPTTGGDTVTGAPPGGGATTAAPPGPTGGGTTAGGGGTTSAGGTEVPGGGTTSAGGTTADGGTAPGGGTTAGGGTTSGGGTSAGGTTTGGGTTTDGGTIPGGGTTSDGGATAPGGGGTTEPGGGSTSDGGTTPGGGTTAVPGGGSTSDGGSTSGGGTTVGGGTDVGGGSSGGVTSPGGRITTGSTITITEYPVTSVIPPGTVIIRHNLSVSKKSSSKVPIVAGALGGIVGLILVGVGIFFLLRRRRRRANDALPVIDPGCSDYHGGVAPPQPRYPTTDGTRTMSEVPSMYSASNVTGQSAGQQGQFFVRNATSPEPTHRPSIDAPSTGGMSSMYASTGQYVGGHHERSSSATSGGSGYVGGVHAPTMGMVPEEGLYRSFQDGRGVVESSDIKNPFIDRSEREIHPADVVVHEDGGRIEYHPQVAAPSYPPPY
ncbi:hypothetical protein DFP72DRAFT_1072536 [Ephemerocybe angulata]|uniref:Uncharacterized protein n=1 Tax=Ephemerocybe angulata TaxID=980116 RepID=A0A8H6M3H6_9AGAR|nr:hypothetical protein DFP72DRAFT_1072536 [Tulosesus angulatus]